MFGDKVRKYRNALGLTQGELGARLNIGKSTISDWESGKRSPDVERLPEIAAALGVPPTELLDSEAGTRGENSLPDVYFRFAKEAEKSNIHPDDIKDAIDMIKRLRGGK